MTVSELKPDRSPSDASIGPIYPTKLLKRKSLGFVQLRKETAAAEEREESRVVSDGLVTTESHRKGALV